VAAASGRPQRVVVFVCVPHGCGKLTEARRHSDVARALGIPHTIVWGGFEPPADGFDGAPPTQWVCLGRVAAAAAAAESASAAAAAAAPAAAAVGSNAHRLTHEHFMRAAERELQKLATQRGIATFIVNVGNARERATLVRSVAEVAGAVGVVHLTHTDRTTAALAGAVGNVRQGVYPSVDQTLREYDQYAGWARAAQATELVSEKKTSHIAATQRAQCWRARLTSVCVYVCE